MKIFEPNKILESVKRGEYSIKVAQKLVKQLVDNGGWFVFSQDDYKGELCDYCFQPSTKKWAFVNEQGKIAYDD